MLSVPYEEGTITGAAAGNVAGYLNDSFSLNEYNGLFIEDTLYLAGNSFLISFDMSDAFAKTGLLRFE